VTYSIASLVKRVAVICIAIVWFAQAVHPIQAFGIALTFGGLYMYNLAKGDVEQGERSMRRVAAARALELPSNRAEAELDRVSEPPRAIAIDMPAADMARSSAYGRPRAHPTAAASHFPAHAHAHDSAPPPPPPPASHPPRTPSGPTTHRAHPPSYSQTHHHAPNLRIQITPPAPPNAKPGVIPTPVDLYPSPPPSLDSPPAEEELDHASAWIPSATTHRHHHHHHNGSMATGHAPPRQYEYEYESAAPRATIVQ